jgi:hypothetical protein
MKEAINSVSLFSHKKSKKRDGGNKEGQERSGIQMNFFCLIFPVNCVSYKKSPFESRFAEKFKGACHQRSRMKPSCLPVFPESRR